MFNTSLAKLTGQKEKAAKKVVVLVSKRNGVEKIKYCQTRKRPVFDSVDTRHGVEEWLQRNVEHTQNAQKHFEVKKKKNLESFSTNWGDLAKDNEFSVHLQKNTINSPSNSFTPVQSRIEPSKYLENEVEELKYPDEDVGCYSQLEETDFEIRHEQFSEEFEKYKTLVETLQYENMNLKADLIRDRVLSEQIRNNLLEDNATLMSRIDYLEKECYRLKSEPICTGYAVENPILSNSAVQELILELKSLKLEPKTSIREESREKSQLQTDNDGMNNAKCHDSDDPDFSKEAAVDTGKLSEKVTELENELRKERSKNSLNTDVIEFFKRKFELTEQDLENVILRVDLENFSRNLDAKLENNT